MQDKEKWIESVWKSMEGSQRAQPDPALLQRIQGALFTPKTEMLPISFLRMAAAACVLLVAVNVAVLLNYAQTQNSNYTDTTEDTALLTDFQIYE